MKKFILNLTTIGGFVISRSIATKNNKSNRKMINNKTFSSNICEASIDSLYFQPNYERDVNLKLKNVSINLIKK